MWPPRVLAICSLRTSTWLRRASPIGCLHRLPWSLSSAPPSPFPSLLAPNRRPHLTFLLSFLDWFACTCLFLRYWPLFSPFSHFPLPPSGVCVCVALSTTFPTHCPRTHIPLLTHVRWRIPSPLHLPTRATPLPFPHRSRLEGRHTPSAFLVFDRNPRVRLLLVDVARDFIAVLRPSAESPSSASLTQFSLPPRRSRLVSSCLVSSCPSLSHFPPPAFLQQPT